MHAGALYTRTRLKTSIDLAWFLISGLGLQDPTVAAVALHDAVEASAIEEVEGAFVRCFTFRT